MVCSSAVLQCYVQLLGMPPQSNSMAQTPPPATGHPKAKLPYERTATDAPVRAGARLDHAWTEAFHAEAPACRSSPGETQLLLGGVEAPAGGIAGTLDSCCSGGHMNIMHWVHLAKQPNAAAVPGGLQVRCCGWGPQPLRQLVLVAGWQRARHVHRHGGHH